MKRLGRTPSLVVAALLTVQGFTAMAAQPMRTATGGPQAALATPDRRALVSAILDLWGNAPNPVDSENRAPYGDLRAALKLATVDQLLEARQGRTYEDVWAALPKGTRSQASVVPLAAGRAITPLVLGSTTADLVFTPITPCRIVDTRLGVAQGLLGPNDGRQFFVGLSDSSSQGGVAGSCGIPTSPLPAAVAINITSVAQTGKGNLRAIQTGVGVPNVSLVNYVAGVNIANAAIVPVTDNIGGNFFIFSAAAQSHAVVDIMGYFSSPAATPLDTTIAFNTLPCANASDCSVTVSCPAGFALTGGGYQTQFFGAGMNFILSAPGGNTWFVDATNNSGIAQNITAYVACARVPGI